MISKLGALQAANGASDALAFLPDFSRGIASEALWTLPVITFVVYLGLQWWAFWYPGAEPGGGGYVAQRIFSARDERQGLFSVLWFNIAHYALRPWPWIFTGLAAIVLYPGLKNPESSYMMIVNAVSYTHLALRLMQKKKQPVFSAADADVLANYKRHVDNATKFIPGWVKVAVAMALGLGTMIGWKRIVVTVGEKIGKDHLTYAQGAAAEITAMFTIGAACLLYTSRQWEPIRLH